MKEKNLLNEEFVFYIKGYRGGKKRTIKDSLWNEYREKYHEKDNDYKNLIFWEPDQIQLSDQEYFINFYSAIDGIISTYSSMVLEASIFGDGV